jgi:DNA replication protein DnaC
VEPIKDALANLKRETNTQRQKSGDNSDRETPERSTEDKPEELRRSLNVSSLNHTFENFEVLPGTAEAYKAFKALAEGQTDRPLLLCYGGVGNGKTHLCEAAIIALYKRGLFCRYLTMARLMRSLKAAMRTEAISSFDVLLERFCRSQRLVLDDVGMGGSGSEWEYGQLEEIVNERYRERLLTIMVTNRDLEELPERIVSRFSDPAVGVIVLNSGADYRRRKA